MTQPQPTEWSRLGVFAPRQGFADPLRQLMQVIPEGTGCSMERLSSENYLHSDHLPYFFNLFSYLFVSFSLFICLLFFWLPNVCWQRGLGAGSSLFAPLGKDTRLLDKIHIESLLMKSQQ